MNDEEVNKSIASAVREHNDPGSPDDAFASQRERCGRLAVRFALIKILVWLEYLGRRGRREPLRVTGSKPLQTISCLLGSGGDFARMFELKDGLLDWRAEVSTSARDAAARYVHEHLKIHRSVYIPPITPKE